MKHHLNVTKINGAEVEPYPIAVTKSRFAASAAERKEK